MKIGIIGSGVVGQTLGTKLVALGHEVVLGTRDPKKLGEKKNMTGSLEEWLVQVKQKAKVATFRDAAAHGEILFNVTHGQSSVEALQMAEAAKVGAKLLIDVANELDFSKGMPPRVLASQDHCLAERIQAAFPNLKVVKSLNTMPATLMVDPGSVKGGDHTVFVAGNDKDAKARVAELLKSMGWTDILDLGDLSSARGPEMYMGMWVRLLGSLQHGNFNIKVQR
ncbi:MAG: NADPH-dependent F420 reductase [Deltaproteobacteria bacterium]